MSLGWETHGTHSQALEVLEDSRTAAASDCVLLPELGIILWGLKSHIPTVPCNMPHDPVLIITAFILSRALMVLTSGSLG